MLYKFAAIIEFKRLTDERWTFFKPMHTISIKAKLKYKQNQ